MAKARWTPAGWAVHGGLAAGLLLGCAALGVGTGDGAQEARPKKDVPEVRIFYQFSRGMRFGLTVLDDRGRRVLLTCFPSGSTNNTYLKIDDNDVVEFGAPAGEWDPQQEALPPPKGGGKAAYGARSVWIYKGIRVTQELVLVAGETKPLDSKSPKPLPLDTCLVRYKLENTGAGKRKVGLRVLIDTLIGENDGCPIAVPAGEGKFKTVKDGGEFFSDKKRGQPLPPSAKVFEKDNEKNPGLVAFLSLEIKGLDAPPPTRFLITHWDFSLTSWDIPLRMPGQDSAVAIFWDPADLAARDSRTVGYAYGRGIVRALPRTQ
jgi:hypothetical protein